MSRKNLIALVVLAVVPALLAAADAPKTLTAEEIVAKYLEAIGGLDKLKSIQSLRMTGKITMGPGLEAPMTMEMKRPSAMRMEFSVQGMTAITAFDGQKGWQVVPFGGQTEPEPLPDDQADDLRGQASIDGPLVDYKEKGTKIEVLGKENLDGVEAYKLKLTSKAGDSRFMYVEAARFLPIRETMSRNVQGNDVEVEVLLGDYRETGGSKFPYAIENRLKGLPMSQKMTIDKIEVNPTIDPARFKMPEKKPAAAPEPKPAEEKH